MEMRHRIYSTVKPDDISTSIYNCSSAQAPMD